MNKFDQENIKLIKYFEISSNPIFLLTLFLLKLRYLTFIKHYLAANTLDFIGFKKHEILSTSYPQFYTQKAIIYLLFLNKLVNFKNTSMKFRPTL